MDVLPVSNAVAGVTALDTTAQVLFAKSAGDKGRITLLDTHIWCAGGGVIVFQGDDDAFATGSVTFSGVPVAAETVTINGQAYTFRAAVGTTAYEVLIGADETACAVNLAEAVNVRTFGSGVLYGSLTLVHPTMSATNLAGVVTLTAKTGGVGGNALTLAEAATNTVVSGANLTGGGSTAFFKVSIAGNGTQSVELPLTIAKATGLSVKTTAATGAGVTCFYYKPTALGLGV